MPLIVEIDKVLSLLGRRQLEEVTPKISDDYERYRVAMAAIAMIAVAEEYDGAAQTRLDENEAIRALLRTGLPHIEDAALREHFVALCERGDTSVRISSLNISNGELREALIALHRYVEGRLSEAWARRLNEAIWAELETSTRRHAFGHLAAFV